MQIDIPIMFPLFEKRKFNGYGARKFRQGSYTQEDLPRSSTLLMKTKRGGGGGNKYKDNYGIKKNLHK